MARKIKSDAARNSEKTADGNERAIAGAERLRSQN